MVAMESPESQPRLGRDVFIAPTSYVGGCVTLGDECRVMAPGNDSRRRGEIRLGKRVNVQDGAVLHAETGRDLSIGDDVSIGHRAVVHWLRIGDRALIGVGAILLDGCVIGRDCVVAAGAVLPPRTKVPEGTIVMGVPARPVRRATDAEKIHAAEIVAVYVNLGRRYRRGALPNVVVADGPRLRRRST